MIRSIALFLFAGVLLADAPKIAEANAPSKTVITTGSEPGERLTVTGVIYGEGNSPIANASVYVYHTDAKGVYTPQGNDSRNPRLRGYMRTDAQGRYEFQTIKPAPYPTNDAPAHVHYHVNAPGYAERVFEIVFQGDPRINAQIREGAAQENSGFSIRALTGNAQSGWRCTQDVKLRK